MFRLFFTMMLALASLHVTPTACAAMSTLAMAASRHAMAGMDHPAPMPAAHDCIGCIAAMEWDGARIVPPLPIAAPLLAETVTAMPLLPGQAPTPPPPRDA